MFSAGQKKGIFGPLRAKTGQRDSAGRHFQRPHAPIRRLRCAPGMPVRPIDAMSLPGGSVERDSSELGIAITTS
jgi:hypothetical protein